MNNWISIAIYVVFIVGMYYVLIHLPRKTQDKRHREMIQVLKPGDRVLTVGGLYGEVSRLQEDTVFLKVADQVEMEFSIRAISGKVEVKEDHDEKKIEG